MRTLKWDCRTNSKEALKITVTPLSSDLRNSTSLGLSFISFPKQEPNFVGRNLPTAGLSSYPCPTYDPWMGRGMESKPYKKILLKTGDTLMLLVLW